MRSQKILGTVPCPICGSSGQKELFKDTLGNDLPSFDYAFSPAHSRTYRIVKCHSCGHAFSIVPKKNVAENYESVVDEEYLKRQDERMMTAKNVVSTLVKTAPCGRLLDVGCATGDFLIVAQDHYTVEGLELSNWSAQLARQRGLLVHTTTLDSMLELEAYDVITLFGVIEHFESPKNEVANLSRIIKPGGIVCLWTGDSDSWVARLLGRKWWYIQGQHIQLFSRRSLLLLFEESGFELILLKKYPFVTNFQSLNKSLRRYSLVSAFSSPILESRLLADRTVPLSLPGEMFAIFRKKAI